MKFDYRLNEELKNKEHYLYLDGFFMDDTVSQGMMEGNGRYNFYANTPVYLEPNQLVIGRLDKGLWGEVVTNTTSMHNLHYDVLERLLKGDDYSAEEKERVKTLFERMKKYHLPDFIKGYATKAELLVEESGAALCQHYNGHMVMDYDYILTYGFKGLIDRLLEYKDKNNNDEFYDALLKTVKGMQIFISKHSGLAEHLIEQRADGYDLSLLERIKACCENIAINPPCSFYEGVLLHWFIMQFADYDSFGRYDQYLYPLYKNDIDSGVMTREEAKSYVKDMMRRVDDNGNIINMTIGGVDIHGNNAVNELTYIVLEATRELGFKGPNLCLRIDHDSDKRLWDEVMINLGAGQALPALYNDRSYIKMLRNAGISERDANNYCLAGCSQAIIPGKSNYSCDMGLYTPTKMLELALFDGFDHRIGKQVGLHTGDATSFTSYEMLFEAYNRQMKYCVELGVNLNNQDNAARREFLSCVRTVLTSPCIERGKGIFDGGAEYYGVQGEVVGITNTANGLMAIRELVYDKKELSMDTLLKALRANFVGYDDVRAKLIKAPKFGNDIDEVDNIRRDITKDVYTEISSYSDGNGGVHWPGEVIFNYYYDQGLYCMASPDGRLDLTVLADSSGPTQGTDLKGPTAIINSAVKLDNTLLCTSTNLNLKFSKKLWQESKSKVQVLFREYFRQGGLQLQVNVLDRQELLDAIECPQQHRGLVVRVGGYSAYFTQLAKDMQIEIASRTEN